jgi:hypothetical protein
MRLHHAGPGRSRMSSLGNVSRAALANLAPLRPTGVCLLRVIAGEGGVLWELKEADPLHQLWPIVLHVADLGSDFPCLDRASVGLHQRRGLGGRAAHPVIELRVIKLLHLAAAAAALAMAAENAAARPG